MSITKKIILILLPIIAVLLRTLLYKINFYEFILGFLETANMENSYMIVFRIFALLFGVVLPLIFIVVFKDIKYAKIIGIIMIGREVISGVDNLILNGHYWFMWENMGIINVFTILIFVIIDITLFVLIILLYRSLKDDFVRKGALGAIIFIVFLNIVTIFAFLPGVSEFLLENIIWKWISVLAVYAFKPFVVFLGLKEIGEF